MKPWTSKNGPDGFTRRTVEGGIREHGFTRRTDRFHQKDRSVRQRDRVLNYRLGRQHEHAAS